jgi:hypothetical protein
VSDGPYPSQDRRAVMAVGPLDRRGERSHRYVIGRHSALRVLLRAHGLEAWLMPPPAQACDAKKYSRLPRVVVGSRGYARRRCV